jgi:8-oxo-dGTP pyrophosphatase MutT (NUDIX family)
MKPSNPNYGGTYYQLAKGKVDPGFTVEETARKEVMEEVGLVDSNIKNLFFIEVDVIKNYRIHIYAAEVIDPDALLPFHYETGDVQWLNVSDIQTKVRKSQHNIIYKAVEAIICAAIT